MANTQDYDLCHAYLLNYVQDIKKQMNQLQMKLILHSEMYPITSISLERIDQHLKEFMNCQRKYLSIRNSNEFKKFADHTMEDELFDMITSNNPSLNNVSINL
jgi:hypothetical protein